MKITLIAFGKLKTPGLREAFDTYSKMIMPAWAEFQEVELKPVEVRDKSEATKLKVKTEEASILLEKLKREHSSRAKVFLLDERGKAMTSSAWAEMIQKLKDQSVPEIVFCIGGSLGFDDRLKREVAGLFSLGPQTTSHELARVMAVEQIYRALSINHGHPYHNP